MARPGILLTQIWGLGIIATKTLGNDFSCSICLFCILLYSIPQTVRLIIFSFCWDLREISLLRSPRLVIILCLSFGNVSYAILSGTKRNSCRECPQSPDANKGPKRRDSVTEWLSDWVLKWKSMDRNQGFLWTSQPLALHTSPNFPQSFSKELQDSTLESRRRPRNRRAHCMASGLVRVLSILNRLLFLILTIVEYPCLHFCSHPLTYHRRNQKSQRP